MTTQRISSTSYWHSTPPNTAPRTRHSASKNLMYRRCMQLEMSKSYILMDTYNTCDRSGCCNMGQDTCCNTSEWVSRRMLVKSILIRTCCCNRQHRSAPIDLRQAGIHGHRTWISCRRMNWQDMSLHTNGCCYLHKEAELWDITRHMFESMGRRNMALDIDRHKTLFACRRNNRSDNNGRTSV